MRFNPDTERGITIEQIDACGKDAINALPDPKPLPFVWDCTNGRGWIANPLFKPEPALV